MSQILVLSLTIFAACQTVHVLWWRVRRPESYAAWVPILTFIFFGVGGSLAAWGVTRGLAGAGADRAWWAWAAIMLCHGSWSLVYLIGYTLVVASSPSLEILKRLDEAPEGLPRSAVALLRTDEDLTGPRIRALAQGSMIRLENGELALGPRGVQLSRVVLFYRHLIGMPDGEGG